MTTGPAVGGEPASQAVPHVEDAINLADRAAANDSAYSKLASDTKALAALVVSTAWENGTAKVLNDHQILAVDADCGK